MVDRRRITLFVLAMTTTCVAGLVLHVERALVAVAVLGSLLALAALVTFVHAAHRHRQWTHQLTRRAARDRVADTDVRLGVVPQGAVVAGLLRPTIYCDTSLVSRLSHDELRAVLLHERAHQRALDPLRLILLSLVAPLLRRSLRGQWLVERLRAEREILADRYAIRHGTSPSVIASALLKMPGHSSAAVAAFGNATELRLRALLGDDIPARPTVTGLWLLAGAAVGTGICTSSIAFDHGLVKAMLQLVG